MEREKLTEEQLTERSRQVAERIAQATAKMGHIVGIVGPDNGIQRFSSAVRDAKTFQMQQQLKSEQSLDKAMNDVSNKLTNLGTSISQSINKFSDSIRHIQAPKIGEDGYIEIKSVRYRSAWYYYLCPNCGHSAPADAWDFETMKYCTNREQRRNYVLLDKSMRSHKGLTKWYVCPICGDTTNTNKLSRVNDLR